MNQAVIQTNENIVCLNQIIILSLFRHFQVSIKKQNIF